MPTIKVIELVGVSTKGWEDAANVALAEASKTVKNITGLDVQDHTARVRDGKIEEYHTTVRIAFRVESGSASSTKKGSASKSAASRSRK